jgi:hypothetical protein
MIPTETSLAIGPAIRWLALALSSVFIFAVAVITAGDAIFRRLQRRALQRSLDKVEWHKFMGVAVLLLLASCLARSAPITGLAESWRYDRVSGSGTLTILNQTHKAITGYCAAISEDSKEPSNYRCTDLMPLVITVLLRSGDAALYEKYGDGTFLPGTSRDMVIGYSVADEYTTVKAAIVVVSYADGTVESTDPRALNTLMEERQREVTRLQQVNKTIKETLADPKVGDHYAAIQTELKRLDAVSENKNDGLGLKWEIKNLPKDDAELSKLVQENEQRIALTQKSVQAPEVQP